MAKFCTKCGKELKNGKCASCDKKEKNVVKEEAIVSTSNIDFKECGMDCLDATKGVFTKPFDAIKNFVSDNKLVSGIIMIVLAAISSGLYKIATIKNAYSATSDKGFNMNELFNLFGGSSAKPDYAKEFFTQAGTQLVIYGFIALFGYLVITKLLKGNATWKQMITAVGISLSVVLLGNLVNSLLVFIDAEVMSYIRGYITSFAYIYSILILYYGVKEVAGIDKDKLFLSVASMSVLAQACWDIIDKIFD